MLVKMKHMCRCTQPRNEINDIHIKAEPDAREAL